MIVLPASPVTRGEALKGVVAALGRELGYETSCGHQFTFPELDLARDVSRKAS
jgi:hypothetical protein